MATTFRTGQALTVKAPIESQSPPVTNNMRGMLLSKFREVSEWFSLDAFSPLDPHIRNVAVIAIPVGVILYKNYGVPKKGVISLIFLVLAHVFASTKKLRDAQNKLKESKAALGFTQGQHEGLSQRHTALEGRCSQLTFNLGRTERELSRIEQELLLNQQKVQRLEGDNTSIAALLENKRAECATLQQQIQERLSQLEALKAEGQKKERDLEEKKAEFIQLQKDNEEINGVCSAYIDQIDAQTKQIEALNQGLVMLGKEYNKLQQELSRLSISPGSVTSCGAGGASGDIKAIAHQKLKTTTRGQWIEHIRSGVLLESNKAPDGCEPADVGISCSQILPNLFLGGRDVIKIKKDVGVSLETKDRSFGRFDLEMTSRLMVDKLGFSLSLTQREGAEATYGIIRQEDGLDETDGKLTLASVEGCEVYILPIWDSTKQVSEDGRTHRQQNSDEIVQGFNQFWRLKDEIFARLRHHIEAKSNVYIHCTSGINRSSMAMLAFICNELEEELKAGEISIVDIWLHMFQQRRFIIDWADPTAAFKDVVRYYVARGCKLVREDQQVDESLVKQLCLNPGYLQGIETIKSFLKELDFTVSS